MQNLETDDKAQRISDVNTNSSHPNKSKRFVFSELAVQHWDISLFYCSASQEESGFMLH